jgi:hypothetical protein
MTRRSRPTTRLRASLALVPVLPALALQGLGGPARAEEPAYVPADGPHVVVETFAATGAPQSFTVPAGVTSLHVVATGGAGGDATSDIEPSTARGGRGAVVEVDLEVTPGDVLSVNVGGEGGSAGTTATSGVGGWNGGGAGGAANLVGAGGGGATDLRTCAPDATGCDSLASRLLVAAGGGGAGVSDDASYAGGDAGARGTDVDGVRGAVLGGEAGTAVAGGAGGAAGNDYDRISEGGPGALGVGGVGGGRTGPDYVPGALAGFEYRGAGGGGGGLYGGGGGGDNRYYGASGGGGSSLVPEGGTLELAEAGTEPSLTIAYDLGPVTTVEVAADPTVLPASGRASTTITATPRTADGTALPGLEVTLASTDPGHRVGAVTDHGDGTYSAVLRGSTTAGAATVTATAVGATTSPSGTVVVTSEAYTAPGITATTASAAPARNGWYRTPVTVTFTCSGTRLATACPAPVVVGGNGRDQVVARTVGDDQGGAAEAVARVSVDRTAPRVKVAGARSGATYGTRRKLTCRATDALSGVGSCRVTTSQRRAGKRTVVSWTGRATDRAGNTATTRGTYTIRRR